MMARAMMMYMYRLNPMSRILAMAIRKFDTTNMLFPLSILLRDLHGGDNAVALAGRSHQPLPFPSL